MSRNKRTRCELPVFVVEHHHNVLPCIYRRIGAKQLAFDNLTLIHFDAHSDMSTPKNLSAIDIQKVNTVYESVNIESWITPMLCAGHVNSVVWIKPPWTEDTMSETSQFLVGCDPESNEICVSSADNYFLSELSYCSSDKLLNAHAVDMYVRTLVGCGSQNKQQNRTGGNSVMKHEKDESLTNTVQCCQNVNKEKNNCDNKESLCDYGDKSVLCDKKFDGSCENDYNDKSFEEVVENLSRDLNKLIGEDKMHDYILDIDLDFFSTEDPFISSLSAEQYYLMKQLYAFKSPVDKYSEESIERCVSERRKQISELKLALESVQKGQDNVQLSDEERNKMFLKFIEESRRQASRELVNGSSSTTNNSSLADSSRVNSSQVDSSATHSAPIDSLQIDSSQAHSPQADLSRGNSPQAHSSRGNSSQAHSLRGNSSQAHSSWVNSSKALSSHAHSPQAHSPQAGSSRAHSSHADSSQCGLVDFEWLHEIGTGVDDCSLPHHKSDWSEITSLIESVRQVLIKLSHPPTVVTIARSSEDGYCPADQVDGIQELVLEMLQSLFGPLDVILQYQQNL